MVIQKTAPIIESEGGTIRGYCEECGEPIFDDDRYIASMRSWDKLYCYECGADYIIERGMKLISPEKEKICDCELCNKPVFSDEDYIKSCEYFRPVHTLCRDTDRMIIRHDTRGV